jgi:glycosyltransferase involved in cell wall biosynthesis
MSRALCGQGHEVAVLTSRSTGYPENADDDGVRVLRKFDRSALRSPRVAELALRAAREFGADWIEVADHWGEGATLLKCRDRPPVVVKMHYNDVLKVPRYAQAWYPWQRRMIDLACLRQWRSISGERYSLKHADVLLAPCQRILDEAERQGIVLAQRRAIVPNPIGCGVWENEESKTPTILLVGRLDVGKGLPYLRGILEQLVGAYPDLIMEIAGGDNYARGVGSVKAWFERQLGPMISHVRFLGVLGQDELEAAYKRAWVVIVPSRWDTFPQVVLEAMSRKKAIVASPHGGMPEMLNETSCRIVDPASGDFADAVKTLIASSTLRVSAGQSAYDKVARVYSPDQVAALYIDRVTNCLHPSQMLP